MKFSLSVDALSKENSFLKMMTRTLFGLMFFLIVLIFYLVTRDPILIQSNTRGREIVKPVSFTPYSEDTKYAVKLMLEARFNSEALNSDLYLSEKQIELRKSEQLELKNKNMSQTILVREIKVNRDEATAEIDRVISVGDLRSAFKAKLKLLFEITEPNELNPYGLVLSLVELDKPEVKK